MNLNHVLARLTFTSCIFRVQVKIPWAIVQPVFRLGAFGFLQGFRQGCANSDCANPHQQKALDETADRQRVAYYLDMGLGKTYVGSEKMMQLAAPVNLIVCQKSKIDDWFNHMVENYAMNHCWLVYNLTDKKDFEWFFKEVENRKSDSPVICGMHIVVNGINLDVELKAPTGRPSELQKFMVVQINECGSIGLILWPEGFPEFKKIIEGVMQCSIHIPALEY